MFLVAGTVISSFVYSDKHCLLDPMRLVNSCFPIAWAVEKGYILANFSKMRKPDIPCSQLAREYELWKIEGQADL